MWKRVLFCCLFFVSVSRSEIKINDFKQTDSSDRLKRDARDLVEMCFTNNSNPVVISEDLLSNDWDRGENSLIVIDHNFNKQITGFLPSYPTYVLSFESIDKLEPIIDNLQRSKFWNIKSPFLMVGTGSHCPSTRKMLEFMWNRDLLSVYYLCDKKNSTVIFTLNPYASYAPEPWKLINKLGDSDKKLTLFRLAYTKDLQICESVTFDKTDRLEGAEIKFVQFDSSGLFSKEEDREIADKLVKNQIGTAYVNLYQTSVLINATPTLDIIPVSVESLQSYIQEFADSKYDIYNTPFTIEHADYEYVDVIADYTTEHTFSILTKKTNTLPGISDVTDDVQFVLGTILLLIMFTVVMIIINRDDISLALMDMMRLISGMTLETPLNRLAMKFIFFFGFLFSFLIVPDFLGHVSVILTKPPERNIDTLKDLYENKFHVYYWDRVENDIMNEQLWVTDEDKKYLHPVSFLEIPDCFFHVQENFTTACVHYTQYLLVLSETNSVYYMSKETVFKKQLGYWARKNWPLKSKFDKVALNALEPGLGYTLFLKKRHLNKIEKEMVKKRRLEASQEYDKLDYDNLIFNCYIFGFLVTFGIMIFGIEMILARYFRSYREFRMRARY